MNRNKKTVMAAAASALAIGLIVSACSGQGGAKQPEGTGSGAAASPSPETASATPAKRGSMSVTIYDRGQIAPDEGTYADNRWTKWVNAKGPVDVKYVPIARATSDQKIPVLFASGDAPDLILEYSAVMRSQLWAQKQLLPLDDLINKYSVEYKQLLQKFPQLKKVTSMPDGKMYQIGIVQKPEAQIGLVIRKDWLAKLNLKVPETIEDFVNVAIAFANNDPDGNGKKDTYGFNMNAHTAIDKMFGSELFIIENDTLVRQFDRIKPAAEVKKKLFESGSVDKDFLTDKTGQKAEQDFANGKTGMFFGQKSAIKKNYEILKKSDPNAVIVPIALPKTSYGQYSPDFGTPIDVIGVVNAKTKDPEAVIKYIDFMNKKSTIEYFENGDEGVHYKMGANGCAEPLDRDKRNKELGYNGDYKMLMSRYVLKTCSKDGVLLSSTNAFDQEWIALSNDMDRFYFDPSRPTPGYTHFKLRPNLEKDLNTTVDGGWTQWHDTIMKAIVSNGNLDQAVQAIKDAWYNSGGQKAEDWHKEWYKENKDKWVFMKDLYEMKVE